MAYGERASSFLPTIKCSMCAQDIEISHMGDHVCGAAPPVPTTAGEPTPPPDSYGNFDRMPYKQNATNGPSYLKPGRAPPPRVDTGIANRPFFPQDELTPVSASPSRSASPMSDGQRSPYMRPLRSATAPIQRPPPSPELLSSNLDSAFPPFPGTKTGSQKKQQGGGYGGMGRTYAEPDSMYAPVSPRTATSGGILQRMNTIAPGPFDGRRKASGPPAGLGHRRNGTGGSLADATMSSATAEIGGSIIRPSTAGPPGHSRTSTNSSNGSRSGIMAPRVPRKQGYGGFGPPSGDDSHREPLTQESRSQTFPLTNESQEGFFRRPSEPRMRRPSNDTGPNGDRSISPARERRKPSMSGPDLTRAPPPRGVSLIRPRVDARLGDAPPVPSNLNLAAEFGIGNPYHTPTESSSSNASGYSDQSKASSRSSPPRSRRQPSDTTKVDSLMTDLESSMANLEPRKMSSSASPPRSRNQYPRLQPQQNLAPSMQSPESPMDPAIQFGRLSPAPLNQSRSPSPLRSERQQPPLQRPSTGNRPATANRPNTGSRPSTSKGNCKGCGEAIKGKSVSSADGRLTGRYHKQCFVCKTCSEPFQTATFYVMDDSPYCERHYHKLNGSVCTTCDKGIEGQYLESERKEKFHPGCLTCADCKRTLRHDYFEMNGRVYCERDAFRRAQSQPRFLGPGAGGPGTNRMERRTTRLMMM
ncbi:hypothetical protein DL98DRAFT_184626 [Cadophora sp. DSE1049]|nr:hypothetical protein DL98DRAFT_184626 [Cadophora sp. DSE1049]